MVRTLGIGVRKRKYADTLLRRSQGFTPIRRYADGCVYADTPIAVFTVRLQCPIAKPK